MHILFEGLDLAGKSTICRLLKQHLGDSCSIRNNSLLPAGENLTFNFANEQRLRNSMSDRAIGFLYYAALIEDIQHFTPVETSEIVIHDSTILARSLAYHQAHQTENLPELFEQIKPFHPQFDAAFYCKVTPETRAHRLNLRAKKNLAADDFIFLKNPEIFASMETSISSHVTQFHHGIELSTAGDLKHDTACQSRIIDKILHHLPTQHQL